jgi:hypothetical protein
VANRKRDKQVKFYLSDEEYKLYFGKIKKANLSQTNFILKCVKGKEIVIIDGLKETLIELKRIGANVNQISKSLNSGYFQGAEKDIREVKVSLSKLLNVIIETLEGVK